jgi:hypothetical protein
MASIVEEVDVDDTVFKCPATEAIDDDVVVFVFFFLSNFINGEGIDSFPSRFHSCTTSQRSIVTMMRHPRENTNDPMEGGMKPSQ